MHKIVNCVLLSLGLLAGCKPAETEALKLWYDAPAAEWVEALPVGNGRMGVMVFGTPSQERL